MMDINYICDFSNGSICTNKAKLQIILHQYTLVEGDITEQTYTFYTCLGKHSFQFMKELPPSQSMRVSVYEMKEYTIHKAKYSRPFKIPAHDKISIEVAKKICFSGKDNSCKFLRANNRELNSALLNVPEISEGQSNLDIYIIRVRQRIIDLEALLNNCYGAKILMSNEAESIFCHLKLYEFQFEIKKTNLEMKMRVLKKEIYRVKENDDQIYFEYYKYLCERYSFLTETEIERKLKNQENNLFKLETNINMVRSKFQFILPHLNHKTAYSTECAICMETIDDDLKGGQLKCKHAFHTDCIKKWFFKNLVCPVCRKNCTKNIHKYLKI
jgi:hypothetical protein